MANHDINLILWWSKNFLALLTALLFFSGHNQVGAVAFASSVICGMLRAKEDIY